MGAILGIYASQISGHLYNNSYTSLQTVTVGSGGASSISFTSIPSTYTHLQLRVSATNTSSLVNYFNFNNDSGANYSYHAVYGDGSTTGTIVGTSATSITSLVYSSTTSVVQFAGVVDILDYANTNKYKTARSLTGWDINGSGSIHLRSGLWQSTAAINSIQVTTGAGSFAQGTQFALYGVN